ncbi:SGNH hydrolase [Cubamyces lactineus]|nr:SGNH hydrolase [Cubamyces lactineus]
MRVLPSIALACGFVLSHGLAASSASATSVVVPSDHPLIYFNGRWDASPGTWWAGSGLKLHVSGLESLLLNLGPHTTAPLASVGVSVNYAPFYTVNVSSGTNVIPLSDPSSARKAPARGPTHVVRINVEGWQNNRINLESIVLNKGAQLLPYTPSKLALQFIGDSLSAGVGSGSQGQFLPQGVNQAWPFLTGEAFKAEHRVNAQPGAALSDIVSYGNEHGLSYQFFKTEDTGYFYTTDHNFTTPWNFARDHPAPTHIIIHIGANDASQNVTAASFVQTYLTFLDRLRGLYPFQPIFVFTPWGWPNADGTVSYYYRGQYERIVRDRHLSGDRNTFLVNTTGWVTWEDVFPDNQHPNVDGHQKIASLFENWLIEWGLRPESHWATPV